jgi:regulator of sigma E protease
MSSEIIPLLLSNIWSIVLVVLFFGGSILIHELGHFWAAKLSGARVERFSIGFGPKIFGWRGKDGVDYRVSWLPLGGYVALPQLVDLSAIEGESTSDLNSLPPISYFSKMFISVAGAVMNLVFALALACVIWAVGQPVSSETASTRIGYVSPSLELSDGSKVPSPALKAGLKAGDRILAIDGHKVTEWYEIMHALMTGSGRDYNGNPVSVFTVERGGAVHEIILHPQLTGAEKDRRVGIAPGYELIVHAITPGSLAEKAGFKEGDQFISLDGTPILQIATYQELAERKSKEGFSLLVKRGAETLTIALPPLSEPKALYGFSFTTGFRITHPNPFTQLWGNTTITFRTLGSLINPQSDIGLSKMAGPVGIVRILHSAATAGMIPILMFTILVNVSLAIFNLMPIPVLDGGHMLFATVAKLRGKALPLNFVATTQGVFMVLLLSMVLYVSFFDIRRLVRDYSVEKTASSAPADSAPASK